MKEIHEIKSQERQAYVPAEVTVIEIAAQNVICHSPESNIEPYNNGGTY